MGLDPILALQALNTTSPEAYDEVIAQAAATIQTPKPGGSAETVVQKTETPVVETAPVIEKTTTSASPLESALNAPEKKEAGAESSLTQTESGAIVNTSGQELTAQEILVIDPNKLIQLPDGRQLAWSKLAGEMHLKAKYDEEKALLENQIAQERAKLEADKKVVSDGAYWLNLASTDPIAASYLQARHAGIPAEQAFAGAAAMAGIHTQAQQTQVQADPRFTPPDGFEPGDPEYVKWQNETYFPALAEKKASELFQAEMAKRDAAAKADRDAIIAKTQAEQQAQAQIDKIAESNTQVLNQLPGYLYRTYGISTSALTVEQRSDLTQKLNQAAVASNILIDDSEWLKSNIVTERDVELIALKALGNKNPYVKASPQTELVQPRIEPEPPLRPGTDVGGSVSGKKENAYADMYEHPAILALRELGK